MHDVQQGNAGRNKMKRILFAVVLVAMVAGCKKASQTSMEQADSVSYKPQDYVNSSIPGPQLVVIPGGIKSANATFTQKVSDNNIADYAEIELSKANFKVLERSDLGPLLNEIQIAAGMGDAEALRKFQRGKFQATRWFVRFDVLKAEPVAAAQKSFDGKYLGIIAGALVGQATDSAAAGAATGATVASAKGKDSSEVWLVGLRYKIMDAVSGEQVATGYFEDKMEIGEKVTSFLGFTESKGMRVGLDTVVQVLVQKAVYEIDKQYKGDQPPTSPVSASASVASGEQPKEPSDRPAPPGRTPQAATAHPSHATQTASSESSAPLIPNINVVEGGGVRMDSESYAKLQQSLRDEAAKNDAKD